MRLRFGQHGCTLLYRHPNSTTQRGFCGEMRDNVRDEGVSIVFLEDNIPFISSYVKPSG